MDRTAVTLKVETGRWAVVPQLVDGADMTASGLFVLAVYGERFDQPGR